MSKLLLFAIAWLPLVSCDGDPKCGRNTFEQNGECVAADVVIDPAACGPFTELSGGQCVPQFPPTVCDTSSTAPEVDNATGVLTCIGTAAGFACPPPAPGTMTVCGQLFDIATTTPFSTGDACEPCTASTEGGPCSLEIRALDAVAFALNPANPAAVLQTGEIVIDSCGRYKIPDIVIPASNPFVALALDDQDPSRSGPAGTTNTTAIAFAKAADVAAKDVELYVAPAATIDAWTDSGGPPIANGLIVGMFRAMRTGLAPQEGVTVLRVVGGVPGTIPDDDFYFRAADLARTTIDPAANATGANGTVVIKSADSAGAQLTRPYSAPPGPLPAGCAWTGAAGVALPDVVFVAVFRPTDASGMTCPR